MRTLLVALTALAVALAGCGSSGGSDEPTDPTKPQPTKGTGILEGVVVTESLVPLAGVDVRALGPGGNTTTGTTDEQGAFAFGGLVPGAWMVEATRTGYFPGQAAAVVRAGVRDVEPVRIVLKVDEATRPFAEQFVFSGYMECGVTVFTACGFLNDVTTMGGAGNLTTDNTQIVYGLTRVPTFVQSEMVWQSTQALGGALSLMYSYGDCGGFYCDHDTTGASPLVLTARNDTVEAIGLGTQEDLYIRVFPGGSEESSGLAGATVQQRFEIYTTVFYGYEPPEGWSFVRDGAIPMAA